MFSPGRAGPAETIIDGLRAVLPGSTNVDWLAPEVAVDILFDSTDVERLAAIKADIQALLAGEKVDFCVQPQAARRKKLLLADMDSTIIGQECIDELADFAGFKAHVAAITEQAMRGEIAFEPALRARVALLRGLDRDVIERVITDRITLTPGALELVATMRGSGAYTALVSGGFTAFTGPIAAKVGFHENRANQLLVEDDLLAGRVAEPILGREAKRTSLQDLRRRFDLDEAQTMAVGDGANDLGMLGDAGLGIAFHAKPAVAAAAHACINHNDLTALLYIQGYRRDEFKTG
jgi:phosphoserine phosphatase